VYLYAKTTHVISVYRYMGARKSLKIDKCVFFSGRVYLYAKTTHVISVYRYMGSKKSLKIDKYRQIVLLLDFWEITKNRQICLSNVKNTNM
jgi:hypothetical protein